MSSHRLPEHDSNINKTSCSPTSNISNKSATTETPTQTTSTFSQPPSPNTSASSIEPFRACHSDLPSLRIPHKTSKIIVEVQGTKRKQESALEPTTEPSKRRMSEQGASLMIDHSITNMTNLFHEQFAEFHQCMAELREELLEARAKVEEYRKDTETMILAQADIMKRLHGFESLMKQLNIPEDRWP